MKTFKHKLCRYSSREDHKQGAVCRVFLTLDAGMKKPPAAQGWRWLVAKAEAQAWVPSTFCSSPLSYISIMMSEPPMNSPLT